MIVANEPETWTPAFVKGIPKGSRLYHIIHSFQPFLNYHCHGYGASFPAIQIPPDIFDMKKLSRYVDWYNTSHLCGWCGVTRLSSMSKRTVCQPCLRYKRHIGSPLTFRIKT
jgi:hypothetical protein